MNPTHHGCSYWNPTRTAEAQAQQRAEFLASIRRKKTRCKY